MTANAWSADDIRRRSDQNRQRRAARNRAASIAWFEELLAVAIFDQDDGPATAAPLSEWLGDNAGDDGEVCGRIVALAARGPGATDEIDNGAGGVWRLEVAR